MMTEQKQDHQNRKLAQLNIFALDELYINPYIYDTSCYSIWIISQLDLIY